MSQDDDAVVQELAAETVAQLRIMKREREAKRGDSAEYFNHAKIVLGFVATYVKLRATRVAERHMEHTERGFLADVKARKAISQ